MIGQMVSVYFIWDTMSVSVSSVVIFVCVGHSPKADYPMLIKSFNKIWNIVFTILCVYIYMIELDLIIKECIHSL